MINNLKREIMDLKGVVSVGEYLFNIETTAVYVKYKTIMNKSKM